MLRLPLVQEKDDCTHWCHPSGYQVWVSQLHAVLRQEARNLPPPPNMPASAARPKQLQRTQPIT